MGKLFPTPLRQSILDLTYYLFSLKIQPSDFPEARLEATKALVLESKHLKGKLGVKPKTQTQKQFLNRFLLFSFLFVCMHVCF